MAVRQSCHIEEPMPEIDFDGLNLVIRAPLTPQNVPILREIPGSGVFSHKLNAFISPPTMRVVQYLRAALSDAVWTEAAELEAESVAGPDPRKSAVSLLEEYNVQVDTTVDDYEFGTKPRPYQLELFCVSRGRTYFAYLMDPRTGKTKPAIDEACWSFEHKGLRRMLVICPKNAEVEWEEQIPFHAPQRINNRLFVYNAGEGKKAKIDLVNWVKWNDPYALQWLIINVQMTTKDNVLRELIRYVRDFKCGVIYDESTTIKNPDSKATKAAYKIGIPSVYRRILTGTAPPNGPKDLYSQFRFLHPNIIGCQTLGEFMETYTKPTLVRFKRVAKDPEILAQLIARHSYRKTFEQVCEFLPTYQFIKLPIQMTAVQASIYEQLKENLIAAHEGREITVREVLTMGMRLMQVTGGFVKWDDISPDLPPEAIEGPNPKLEALLELCERYAGQKLVIWAHFRAEIKLIEAALQEKYGADAVGTFYGGTSDKMRERSRNGFQDPDSPLIYFVANPQSAGMAMSLWRANTAIYFSNTFDYLYRKQSQDRIKIDRPDKTSLGYYDLVVPGTWDERALRALSMKQSMAEILQGDVLRKSLREML